MVKEVIILIKFSERGPNPPIYLDPDKIFDFYKNYDLSTNKTMKQS